MKLKDWQGWRGKGMFFINKKKKNCVGTFSFFFFYTLRCAFYNYGIHFFFRRTRELEQRVVEEEAAKRIEEMVKKRVEEELEKRKDEIDAEVEKRVEEAKRLMEAQMMEELERRRQIQLEAEKKREVNKVVSESLLNQFLSRGLG